MKNEKDFTLHHFQPQICTEEVSFFPNNQMFLEPLLVGIQYQVLHFSVALQHILFLSSGCDHPNHQGSM